MEHRRKKLSSHDADLIVDLDNGCRLASLRIGGQELLVTTGRSPIEWGLYPMAPYAGRLRHGSFEFDGQTFEVPRTLNGHAIHGTVYLQEWEEDGDSSFVTDLGSPWPFPGFVRQDILLDETSVRLRLEIHTAESPMPAACGWHPWFRRLVADAPLELDFRPGFMLLRDEEGIASRDRAAVPEGPWDDCFGGVTTPPVLHWPGHVRMQMTTDCDWWVVYNERPYATCLEPQTAPPDSLNHHPHIVIPGRPLVANLALQWTRPK